MSFSVKLFPNTPSLSIRTPGHLKNGVAPGANWDIKIIAHPPNASEWTGFIALHGKSHNGEEYAVQIPAYLRSVEANDKHPRVGLLPKKVPGAIHRRSDHGVRALQRQDLTPVVSMRECYGANHSGVSRPDGIVITRQTMVARRQPHKSIPGHMSVSKSHLPISKSHGVVVSRHGSLGKTF